MKNKTIIWWVLAGILALILAVLVIFYFNYNRMVVKSNKTENKNTEVTPTATPTPDPLAAYSILLLGYGGGTHEGGQLTDSIMVAKIDPRDEEVTLISVPRDLWVPVPISLEETVNKKVNEVFVIGSDDKKYPNKQVEFTGEAGGGEMAKKIIGEILGLDINYFTSIDFDGFIKIIDILGGIEVKVARTFDDPYYPIETNINDACGKTEDEMKALEATMSGDKLDQEYTCRYEILHFDKGVGHMDGITALKFARSRHSNTDGGDFNRAERQKLVIAAVRDKIISIGFMSKIIPTIQTLTRHIKTDIGFSKMSDLVKDIPAIANYKIQSVALTDKNVLMNAKASTGQFILSPKAGNNNWSEVQEFIKNKGVATTEATINPEN